VCIRTLHRGCTKMRSTVQACLYERFPEYDFTDVPMPAKIEWFCFPNGSSFLENSCRPQVQKQSFVMINPDHNTYGVSLCFYVLWPDRWIEGSPRAMPDTKTSHPRNLSTTSSPPGSASSAEGSVFQPKTWMPICVCFLTRAPFVRQLSSMLDTIYAQAIEPRLPNYEMALATTTSLFDFISTNRLVSLMYPTEHYLVRLATTASSPELLCICSGATEPRSASSCARLL
jgi:hypothetical protein